MVAKDTRQAFLRELDRLWPGMSRAFIQAIRDVRSNVALRALEQAIERRDLDAAFAALRMDRGILSPPIEALTAAYFAGGKRVTDSVVAKTKRFPQGSRIIARFDVGNPRAAEWTRAVGSRLVTGVLDEAREVLTTEIARGLEAGRNPRAIAVDIAGRVEGRRRVGGLIGLDSARAEYVGNMRESLTGPEVGMRGGKRAFWIKQDGTLGSAYGLRDRRFDAHIARAIRGGTPLPQSQVERMVGRYSDRLLKSRADTIAQTEVAAAQSAAQREAYQQLIDDRKVAADAVEYEWDDTGDGRTRDSHRAADGQRVMHGQPFTVGGSQLLGPGDISLGAPARETVRCRCYARPVLRLDR